MDHIAAIEERIVTDKIRRKLEEVNIAAQNQLQPIQDHVNFSLQQAYFKCAYECFDRKRRQEEINNCVEHCSTPVLKANNLVETEMAQFQDKFEAAKLQQVKTGVMSELESCVNQAVDDSIRILPHIVTRLKNTLSIS
ncbi:hypothetical protein HPP92_023413 [Vanilla planifolia]|uniref:Protein FAM136A n=1 Tax=Vanilla planifolia TaxID=51239 RepID=A0A835UGQ6_VANPL|nr:hypothetical protein HPP92_023413 [Vanilla planifolia]